MWYWIKSTYINKQNRRDRARVLWIVSLNKPPCLKNISNFFLTWKIPNKILESRNAELPYVNKFTVIFLFSYLEHNLKEKKPNVPEKDDKWKGEMINKKLVHNFFAREKSQLSPV